MIGIVGGSGDFGQGLAERLRRIGEDVVIGSRTPRDDFVSNVEACSRSELIFLSVPPGGVERMSSELARDLAGRIVVSVASPVVFVDGKPGAAPGEISLAEVTALAAPEARVVAGFHTVSAKLLADPDKALDEDVLVCGDDAEAKEVVCGIAGARGRARRRLRPPRGRPLAGAADCGAPEREPPAPHECRRPRHRSP